MRLSVRVAVFVGLLTLVAALGVGHLLGAFLGHGASPYLAVANGVVDLTPGWLKEFAIDTFGTADKLVLLVTMAAALVAIAALAGLTSRTRAAPGLLLVVVLGVVATVAVLARSDLGRLAVLAPLASLATGVVVFRWLHSAAMARTAELAADEGELAAGRGELEGSRRRFLVVSASVAAGAGVAGLTGQWLTVRRDVELSRSEIGPLTPERPAPPIPDGADFVADGTPSLITPNDEFYRIDTALVVPRVRPEDWRLRLHGLVSNPVTLSYAELVERPLVERTITLACVSNEIGGDLISTSNFIGVDLRDLLLDAGARPGAEQLFSTSTDGFTAGTPLDVVLEPERGAMLAVGMNGEPLPIEHGFPVRMVVPGLYGFVSATKWLTDLEVTTWDAERAYWLSRGWAREAPVKLQSRIDAPAAGSEVPEGKLVVAGVAWAQPIGIGAVEVRVDDGPWQSAELAVEVNGDTWRPWRVEVPISSGGHKLTCRATDLNGTVQTADVAPVVPDGATGWHSVRVTAG